MSLSGNALSLNLKSITRHTRLVLFKDTFTVWRVGAFQ